MPTTTNLNQAPYWDDYYQQLQKNYYRWLMKPGVSVQARELNNIQASFQNQIESFADNIFTSGTIVSGCNFQFYNPYPYIKINDIDAFNKPALPGNYVGYNILNTSTGLTAKIVNFADGFQASDPALKTLYLNYTNSGNTGANVTSFNAGDVLEVYDPVLRGIEAINVINGGISFANNNTVVVVSPIIATLTTGVPTVGTYLNNGNGLTNVQIVSVTNLNTANQYVLQVTPRVVDLANAQCNSQFWTFSVGDNITNPAATLTMTVNQLVGAGLVANIVTNGVGTIVAAPIISKGVGYVYDPTITVQSPNNNNGYTTLNLQAQNFLTEVVVASTAQSVGNGYAFGISQGIIYQKGTLVRVNPQVVIINNYSQTPDNTAVGFVTNESIINFNIDPSLLDNANGTPNFQAPGADRLQLTPQLLTMSIAAAQANTQFQTLVQWKEGQPYLQKPQTIYSTIGAEMAQTVEDVSGDFVIDPFVVTTRSPLTSNQEGEFFNVVVDPGTAYISGYKVATSANFNINDEKGTDTRIVNNHAVSLNYGNYLIINNVAGQWQFNIGDTVNLYDTPKSFYNVPGTNLNPLGNKIGTANMRSMTLYQGAPGQGATQYLLYLFNVNINSGANFMNVCSISYAPSANLGVADVVLLPASNVNSNVAVLQQTDFDQLVFYSGVDSLKNANGVIYTYRTTNNNIGVTNGNVTTASIVIDISSSPETFPYGTGSLSSGQLQDFYIVPTATDLLANASLAGTVSISPSSNVANGSGTSFFSALTVGDFVYVTANASGGHDLKQITGIVNNTSLQFNSPTSYTNTVATLIRCFPQNVPIPFGFRSGLTGSVNNNENIVTLNFNTAFTFSGNSAIFGEYNVERSNNPTQLTKTANRNVFVLINTSTNAGGTIGPWCLGVPDVFRLRGVYIGNSSVSNTGANYVSSFFSSTGQNADFYGLAKLRQLPGTTVPISGSTPYLLVQFDYFTTSGVGYYDAVSYRQTSNLQTIFAQDSLPLANLTTFVNTFEVPEVFNDDGSEFDLLAYIDFRPYAAATASPSTTYNTAPLNPSNTVTLSTSGEKKFPLPGSNFIATVEGFEGRIDSLFVDKTGAFSISTGSANANFALCRPPNEPPDTIKIVDIAIPPYPDLPTNLGPNINQILNLNVIDNQHFKTTRIQNHTVFNLAANSAVPFNQPSRYTQYDIGNMDRRLKQVEYFVQLNTLESNAAALQIPSSVVPGQTRIAYGVFADDFTSSNLSDIQNPEYEAMKQGTDIWPTKMLWDLSLLAGTNAFIESPILHQDAATVGGVTDPLGLGPVCAINLANTVAYTQFFRNATDMQLGATSDSVTIQMANSIEIFSSIGNTSQSLTQLLATNQYTPFSSTSITGPQDTTTTQNMLLAALQDINSLGAQGFDLTGFSASTNTNSRATGSIAPALQSTAAQALPGQSFYDANTQTLFIFAGTQFHATSAPPGSNGIVNTSGQSSIPGGDFIEIPNIPQNVATEFGQAFLGQITWQQFFASLNVTGVAPSGGNTFNGLYHPPVAFYFYDYDQGVRYDIYQGSTLIASTDPLSSTTNAQNLTSADIALLTGSPAQFWFNDQPQYYMQNFSQSAGYDKYAGKILFNYDPTQGSAFTIKATPSTSSFRWRYVIAYPVPGQSVGCVPPAVNITPQTTTFQYTSWCGNDCERTGTVTILTGFTATWAPGTNVPTTAIVPFDASADWL